MALIIFWDQTHSFAVGWASGRLYRGCNRLVGVIALTVRGVLSQGMTGVRKVPLRSGIQDCSDDESGGVIKISRYALDATDRYNVVFGDV